MPTLAASKLFSTHRKQIACAIARQIQQTIPPYRDVDTLTLARNVDGVLNAVQQILRGGAEHVVFEELETLRLKRAQQGFSQSDFLVAVLCALPVIRRFYLNRASTPEVGLRFYEEIEAILIPLYGEWAGGAAEGFDAPDTEPGAASPLHEAPGDPSPEVSQLVRFSIVTIDDVADDPETQPFLAAGGR